jgi:hypothetical protein
MGQPSLRTIPWVRQQAKILNAMESWAKFSGLPKGTARATVIDVNDPEERGRVRVLFDAFNGIDIPQVEGAGVYSQSRNDYDYQEYVSHWIDVSPAFKGKQPPGLVGKRVNVVLSSGQYKYAILQDVLNDPELLTDSSKEFLKSPNNSTMSRLPVYPAGQLPLPVAENIGCMVIEEGGPMNSDWTCVCLKRDGKYIWVRHGDLAHGHAGGNDVTQQVDSAGNRPAPAQLGAVGDYCFPTSGKQMVQYSAYGTDCRGNPWGKQAYWHAPPMGIDGDGNKIEPLPVKEGTLFDQAKAVDFNRLTGYPGSISGGFSSNYNPNISTAVEAVPGVNFVGKYIEKAQKLFAITQRAIQIAQGVQNIVQNPTETATKFVQDTATAAAASFIPQSSQAAIDGLTNPQGFIQKTYNSIAASVASGIKNAIGL